jgi:hypothetical protein
MSLVDWRNKSLVIGDRSSGFSSYASEVCLVDDLI